ncbi:MAG: polysaccharide deacetylase family protein [Deferribacteraceae bacterium]|jgi:peptidoglycan/xylan/chitin deacetylase (PgdA/CDA1 family)|nr:polysaccharide deacetylase family protein [Deferribacteraceae bacterium]
MIKKITVLLLALAACGCVFGGGAEQASDTASNQVVLFENGTWAAQLGEITFHTPGGSSTCVYEDGMIVLTNGVETSKNVAFRFVFENLVDMRGYDAIVMELDEAPDAWFGAIARFRIDQDAAWVSENHTATIRMAAKTNENDGTMVGMDALNWDLQRLRGVGGLPAFGKTVKIKRIYLEGDGKYEDVAINSRNVMDILPPRTGNKPIREITTSGQYTGVVAWSPDHETFQPDTAYTATITLTPKAGWTLAGVPENWFRIFTPTGSEADATVTHAAGSNVLTKTFGKTVKVTPYPRPTKFVALSYDDLYLSDMDGFMDAIEALQIHVTFFASGINLEQAKTKPERKAMLDRILAGGHEVNNHAWQHERYDDTADLAVTKADFTRNQELLKEMTGKTPTWIRVPYASHGANSLKIAGELGLTNLRGLATNDWNLDNSASFLVNRILTATGGDALMNGQIYVGHNQLMQTNTSQALPEIVHELRMRGYGFMTISELREFTGFKAEPGVNYPNFVK